MREGSVRVGLGWWLVVKCFFKKGGVGGAGKRAGGRAKRMCHRTGKVQGYSLEHCRRILEWRSLAKLCREPTMLHPKVSHELKKGKTDNCYTEEPTKAAAALRGAGAKEQRQTQEAAMTGGAALNRKTTGRKGSPSLPTHQTTYSPSPKASADMGDYKENPDSRKFVRTPKISELACLKIPDLWHSRGQNEHISGSLSCSSLFPTLEGLSFLHIRINTEFSCFSFHHTSTTCNTYQQFLLP
ncbi:uncharacterized protein WM277_025574 isoform 1-T1 [Molossus nigricans]